jgi:hypothetical protein
LAGRGEGGSKSLGMTDEEYSKEKTADQSVHVLSIFSQGTFLIQIIQI